MFKNLTRYELATLIAVFFHAVGLAGLLFSDSGFFIAATPLNLLLSCALLIWTQPGKNSAFVLFMFLTMLIGYFCEVAGVNTGVLFGDYSYGKVLGLQWMRVPLMIGVNWFIIIYCCGISTYTLLEKITRQVAPRERTPTNTIRAMAVIADGATLAVIFDWLMEPVAVKLGFWSWLGDGTIPLFNYLCWLVVSVLLLMVFHLCSFQKRNKFAIHLLLIQALFFLVLRTFLP